MPMTDMISELPLQRAPAQLEEQVRGDGPSRRLVLFAIRTLNYLTNHVINHVPSFALRRLWYERVIGARFGDDAGMYLGCYLWYYTPRKVRMSGFRLGAGSHVNRGCVLDIRGGLDIGKQVSISTEAMILTASHQVNDPRFGVELRPVVIEDYAWVGSRAVILPGVRLGRGCVVAAGAVVTRDVPPLTVVAGVPARPVAERESEAITFSARVALPLFE
jgi:acetyltransferase-like isoleucine patch superfamily enzyme